MKRLDAVDRSDSADRQAAPVSLGDAALIPFGHDQTNDRGEFRISGLPPGEYIVVASPPSDVARPAASSPPRIPAMSVMASTYFPSAVDVSAAEPVTVQAGETAGDLVITLVAVPAFQVSGVVVDDVGAPMQDVTVMLVGAAGRAIDFITAISSGPRGMTTSDEAGRFTFEDVPPGSYTLSTDRHGAGSLSGGIGSQEFIIDGAGIPRATAVRLRPEPAPGTLEVTVENASVSDLRLVLPGEIRLER